MLQVVGPNPAGEAVRAETKSTHLESRSDVERQPKVAEGSTWP